MDLGRTFRTLRPLHWSQLAARARIALLGRRRPAQRARDFGTPAALPLLPTPHEVDISGLGDGRFRHLNAERRLGTGPVAWQLGAIAAERLWVVTLHYHEWAAELARANPALLERLLRDWIQACDPDDDDALALAWNAYAIATRIPNWVRAWQAGAIGPGFRSEFLASLWRQAAFLAANLEWDLRANHLLRDAAGLAWAGRFFDHAPWRRTAAELALAQAREQVSAEGLHFELSPMYHDHALHDLGELCALLPELAPLRETAARMRAASLRLRHPDGDIALLNDASLTPRPRWSRGAEAGPEPAARVSPDSFFFRDQLVCYRGEPWSLFFDVGAIGPDCQPGHAHADSLSIEASYAGARLFVDPGTYAYDLDARRRYDRSTAAHNTVALDRQDSSEVWHIFRVGRRARPIEPRASFARGGLEASGSHDGYDHLPGRPRHRREVALEGARLRVRDRIGGDGTHELEGGWLLAPAVRAAAAPGGFRLGSARGELRVAIEGPPQLRRELATRAYHPEFGVELETQRLAWHYRGPLPVEITTVVEPA